MKKKVKPTIYVDLDGTLIFADTVNLTLWLALRHRPFRLLYLLCRYCFCSWATIKSHIYTLSADLFDPQTLAYNLPLLEWLSTEKTKDRLIIVVSGSEQRAVAKVVEHLNQRYQGLFATSYGSDPSCNLIANNKRTLLDKLANQKPYDYIGNSAQDIAPWQGALESGGKAFAVHLTAKAKIAIARLNLPVDRSLDSSS